MTSVGRAQRVIPAVKESNQAVIGKPKPLEEDRDTAIARIMAEAALFDLVCQPLTTSAAGDLAGREPQSPAVKAGGAQVGRLGTCGRTGDLTRSVKIRRGGRAGLGRGVRGRGVAVRSH